MLQDLADRLGFYSREALLVLALSIDIYYRVEWFQMNTSLKPLLDPLFIQIGG